MSAEVHAVQSLQTRRSGAQDAPFLQSLFAARCDHLRALGLQVPGDISVMGFDGIPVGALMAPVLASVVQPSERIGDVALRAGVNYTLPDLKGPSAGDVAAAAEMSAEDRQAMIEGMVAQLSDRLATEGGPVEDWDRLIRSLAVLERLDQAQAIYDEAKLRFEGRPAELSFLRLAAVESGLLP